MENKRLEHKKKKQKTTNKEDVKTFITGSDPKCSTKRKTNWRVIREIVQRHISMFKITDFGSELMYCKAAMQGSLFTEKMKLHML